MRCYCAVLYELYEGLRLLTEHHAQVRRQLAHYRGLELDTAGDGFSPASTG